MPKYTLLLLALLLASIIWTSRRRKREFIPQYWSNYPFGVSWKNLTNKNSYKRLTINPPVDLYLIFEKSSWKNQVRWTGFLAYKNQSLNWKKERCYIWQATYKLHRCFHSSGNLWFMGTKGTQVCQRNWKEYTRKNRQ